MDELTDGLTGTQTDDLTDASATAFAESMDEPVGGAKEGTADAIADDMVDDTVQYASEQTLEATKVVPRPMDAPWVTDVPVPPIESIPPTEPVPPTPSAALVPPMVDADAWGQVPPVSEEEVQREREERRRQLDRQLDKAERLINSAYATGRADRAKITRSAQLDAAEAVAMVGIAMEADEDADEAMRITVIAQKSGDPEHLRRARKREREARKKAMADHRAATRSARQAYEAIKFSSPNRMGFMRVVMILLAVHIVGVLLSLIMTSRDTVVYDSANLFTWVMVVLEGVAFWLFANRLKVARPFMIFMGILGLAADIIFEALTHTVGGFALTMDSIYYIFLILYFSFSKRVKMVLVNDFASFEDIDDDFKINRAGWPFIRNLIIYFIVFSVLGHWMEAAMCQLIRLGLVAGEYDPTNTMLWRDWFYPFPMEGAAVVIIALALYPLYEYLRSVFKPQGMIWAAYVLSFLANALTCSVIEFSMGMIINADHSLWDYTDMFCNILGQVCLQNAFAFGAAASIITWFVYPWMERSIARVPADVMNIVAVVIIGIGGILWSLYIIDPPERHSAVVEGEQLAVLEKERSSLQIDITSLRMLADQLENDVATSTSFDSENVQPDINNLKRVIDVIERDLGLDKANDAGSTTSANGTTGTTGITAPYVSDVPPMDVPDATVQTTVAPVEGGEAAAAAETAPAPEATEAPEAEAVVDSAPAPEQAPAEIAPEQVTEAAPLEVVPEQTAPEAVSEAAVGEEPVEQQFHIAA